MGKDAQGVHASKHLSVSSSYRKGVFGGRAGSIVVGAIAVVAGAVRSREVWRRSRGREEGVANAGSGRYQKLLP